MKTLNMKTIHNSRVSRDLISSFRESYNVHFSLCKSAAYRRLSWMEEV